jgi:hypothetical protein
MAAATPPHGDRVCLPGSSAGSVEALFYRTVRTGHAPAFQLELLERASKTAPHRRDQDAGQLPPFPIPPVKLRRTQSLAATPPHRSAACTVAYSEGVETLDQAAYFSSLNCDQLQGYLLGKPLPITELPMAISKDYSQFALKIAA